MYAERKSENMNQINPVMGLALIIVVAFSAAVWWSDITIEWLILRLTARRVGLQAYRNASREVLRQKQTTYLGVLDGGR